MGTPVVRAPPPRWLNPAAVVVAASALALLAVTLAAAFLGYQLDQTHRRELHNVALLARSLEDHANRTFNAVDVTLATVADTLASPGNRDEALRQADVLRKAQQGLPVLRSVSLVDAAGQVINSSVASNVGTRLNLRLVPLPLPGAVDRLGPLVAGRDLADARAPGAGDSRHSFVPLSRAIPVDHGPRLYLVAALNPEFFANEYPLMLGNDGHAAALLTVQGVLLSATEGITRSPSLAAGTHRFFTDYLPARESGSFVGPGFGERHVVTAFRTLRQRPLAVVVERDYDRVWAEWGQIAGWVAVACGLVCLLIGVTAAAARRSLAGHAAVQAALHQSELAVAASEQQLRVMVESVHELVFRTDPQGRIGFVNAHWQPFFGRPVADALGHRLADFCAENDRPAVDALFNAAARHDTPSLMLRIAQPQGGHRTLEVSVASVTSDTGGLNGFAGFALDVTEREEARSRLEAQLTFTARLLEVNPTPLFVKDNQGRLVMVNQAWLDLMNLPREAVIGNDAQTLFGDAAAIHTMYDQRLLKSEDAVRYESRLERPGRPPRDTVLTKVRFTDAAGLAAGLVGSIVDVTEFREAERSIRLGKETAERANQTQSEFIAHISHELRTPLQSIIGFSELGGDMAQQQPALQEMFKDIQSGGQRMLTLVNGLLDLAKMDRESGLLNLQTAHIGPLMADVIKEFRPLAVPRRLTLAWLPTHDALYARVDAFRLQQVFRNVLANAVHHAPDGSTVEVTGGVLANGSLQVRVADRGPGIPPAELEKIFDTFVQSSRQRDRRGGTGLGLTISRRIMQAHGGRIHAENRAGGGTEMVITLPAERVMSGPAEAAPAPTLTPA